MTEDVYQELKIWYFLLVYKLVLFIYNEQM